MQLPIPDIVDLLVYIFESVELKSEAYDKIKPTENLSRAKRFSKASDNNHNKCLCYVRYIMCIYAIFGSIFTLFTREKQYNARRNAVLALLQDIYEADVKHRT